MTFLDVDMDRIRSRRGIKWGRYGEGVLAAWVADMDFDPPPQVTAALARMVGSGDLGYDEYLSDRLAVAFADYQERHHGWRPDVDRLHRFTSVLHAVEVALSIVTRPGDGVVLFTPVYHPFFGAVTDSGRRIVDVPLDPAGWRVDPERLEAAIDERTTAILVSHPHNPTGRVYDEAEIAAIADVADRHDLTVLSDEIWGDLTHDGRPHRPFATVDDRFAGRLVTLGSASKTFNLAGLRVAMAHVDHAELHRTLSDGPLHVHGLSSSLGVEGTHVAWTQCDDWRDGAMRTIEARRDQIERRLADIPGVTWEKPEATYLGWLDFSGVDRATKPAELLESHGLVLVDGSVFRPTSGAYARINFATSEAIVDRMLDRIATATS